MSRLVGPGLAVAAAALLWPWAPPPPRAGTLADRLVGPFSSLAASAEWVRFDAALAAGRTERAYAHAERALELDPAAPQAWIHFAAHLVHDRGSAENEPRAAARRRWILAGIDLLERGEARTVEPGDLAFARALAWTWVADVDEPTGLGWPGGARAAAAEAVSAFGRAAELGHPDGTTLAVAVRDTWGL